MAYMDSNRKAVIAANLKPILKKYGIKGTLSVRNHSAIVLTLKSGRINFISNCNRVCGNSHYQVANGFRPNTSGHSDVNPYWFQEHYDGEAREFLTEAFAALKSAGWYDESNAQIDYFDISYYANINVGKWSRPYIVE